MTDINSENLPDTFCILPFIHSATRPNGTFRLCCKSRRYAIPKDGYTDRDYVDVNSSKLFNADQDNLNDYWNSEYMKKIRKQFLNGEKPEACNVCWDEENDNKTSMRKQKLRQWKPENYIDDINYAYNNDGEVKNPPRYLDLKLGNLCNLKCRMCGPNASNQFEKEIDSLTNGNYTKDGREIKLNKEYNVPFHITDQLTISKYDKWYEKNNFWDTIYEWIPYVEKLYATGGEPTVNKYFFDFLEYCIQKGYAENIILQITTNVTTINKRFLELCKYFKEVILACSIDGYGKLNEYIRYPSNWSVIDKNFKKLIDLDNVIISITIVVQIYNILNLSKLLDYLNNILSKRKYDITFVFCYEPYSYDIKHLPKNLKQESINRLNKYSFKGIQNILNYLISNINNFDENMFKEFVKRTNAFDYMREQNFRNYLDEKLIYEIENYIN